MIKFNRRVHHTRKRILIRLMTSFSLTTAQANRAINRVKINRNTSRYITLRVTMIMIRTRTMRLNFRANRPARILIITNILIISSLTMRQRQRERTTSIRYTRAFMRFRFFTDTITISHRHNNIIIVIMAMSTTTRNRFRIINRHRAHTRLANMRARIITRLLTFTVSIILRHMVTDTTRRLSQTRYILVDHNRTFETSITVPSSITDTSPQLHRLTTSRIRVLSHDQIMVSMALIRPSIFLNRIIIRTLINQTQVIITTNDSTSANTSLQISLNMNARTRARTLTVLVTNIQRTVILSHFLTRTRITLRLDFNNPHRFLIRTTRFINFLHNHDSLLINFLLNLANSLLIFLVPNRFNLRLTMLHINGQAIYLRRIRRFNISYNTNQGTRNRRRATARNHHDFHKDGARVGLQEEGKVARPSESAASH